MTTFFGNVSRIISSASCCKIVCCTSEDNEDGESEIAESKVSASDLIITKAISKTLNIEEKDDSPKTSNEDLQLHTSIAASTSCGSTVEIGECNETSVTIVNSSDESAKPLDNECHSPECDALSDCDSVDPKNNEHDKVKESTSDFARSKMPLSEIKHDYNAESKATDIEEQTHQSFHNNSENENITDVSFELDSSDSTSSNPKHYEDYLFEESSSKFSTLKESNSDVQSDDCVFANKPDNTEQSSNENHDTFASGIEKFEENHTQTSHAELQNFPADVVEDVVNTESSTNDVNIAQENTPGFAHANDSSSLKDIGSCLDKYDTEKGKSSTKTDETNNNSNEELRDPALDILDMLKNKTESVCQNNNREFELVRYMEGIYKWQKVSPDSFVIVKGQTFKCHKEILIAQSQHFRQRLGGRSNTQRVLRINSEYVSIEAFQAILTYLYEGHMEVNCQLIREVYNTASYLQIKGAIDKCLELIISSKQQLKCFLNLYAFSYGSQHMQKNNSYALQTLSLNFEAVVFSNDYLHLSVNQIVEVFSQDELGTRSEVVVFLAALKWIQHNFLEREQHSASVLSTVRFEQMTTDELLACHIPPLLPGIVKMQEIKNRMHDSLCFVVARNSAIEKSFKSVESKPRNLLKKGQPLNLWDLSSFDDCVLEYRRKVEQNIREVRNNDSTVLQSSNEHYGNLLKQLFQKNLSSAEDLEF